MSQKPFELLLGSRVAIKDFTVKKEEGGEEEQKNSGILLLDDTQKEVDAEKAEKDVASTERFEILQVREGCEFLKEHHEGMMIHIEKATRTLDPANAEPVIEDGKILAFIIPERMITGVFPSNSDPFSKD